MTDTEPRKLPLADLHQAAGARFGAFAGWSMPLTYPAGVMKEQNARLAGDPDLAARYAEAHKDYLTRREAAGHVPEIEGVSAGGMPIRVKCLHVHLGHRLAVGPGVNPIGDETLALVGEWWAEGPCV